MAAFFHSRNVMDLGSNKTFLSLTPQPVSKRNLEAIVNNLMKGKSSSFGHTLPSVLKSFKNDFLNDQSTIDVNLQGINTLGIRRDVDLLSMVLM